MNAPSPGVAVVPLLFPHPAPPRTEQRSEIDATGRDTFIATSIPIGLLVAIVILLVMIWRTVSRIGKK